MSDKALRRTAALLSTISSAPVASIHASSPLSTSATAGPADFRAVVLDSPDKGKTINAAVKRVEVCKMRCYCGN